MIGSYHRLARGGHGCSLITTATPVASYALPFVPTHGTEVFQAALTFSPHVARPLGGLQSGSVAPSTVAAPNYLYATIVPQNPRTVLKVVYSLQAQPSAPAAVHAGYHFGIQAVASEYQDNIGNSSTWQSAQGLRDPLS
jgi:hypothetical protein